MQALRPVARAAILAALDVTGNPSSVHQAGRAARRIMEDAREDIARRFGGRAERLIFTSGGTEANATAIHALSHDRCIIISAIEHDAIRAAAPQAVTLPVHPTGVADLDALARLLGDGVPSLVCLMLANNETGVVQPVQAAAALCRTHGAVLHVDASAGGWAGCRSICLPLVPTASRFRHTSWVGRRGSAPCCWPRTRPSPVPLIGGGGQERGRRGGTRRLP